MPELRETPMMHRENQFWNLLGFRNKLRKLGINDNDYSLKSFGL